MIVNSWSMLSAFLLVSPSSILPQEKEASSTGQSKAPIGTYVSFQEGTSPFAPTNRTPVFGRRRPALRPKVAKGRWQWGAQKREFPPRTWGLHFLHKTATSG